MTKETDLNWNIKLVNNILITKDFKLPNNTDCFELTDITNTDKSSNKMKFNISSTEQYYNYIEECALQYQRIKILQNNGKMKRMTDLDVYNILKQYRLLSVYVEYDNEQKENQLYFVIKDYEDLINMYRVAPINTILNKISQVLNISNFTHLKSSVISKLYNTDIEDSKFEVLNIAPKHIVLFENGILNTKTLEFSTNINEFGTFDFISKINYKLLHSNDITHKYYNLINDWFYKWTNNDDERIALLKQLAINVLEGNGHNKYFIIEGDIGNGPFVYLKLLNKLVYDYSFDLNMQNMTNDKFFRYINNNVKLISGYYLNPNIRLTDKLICRIKNLINYKPAFVNKIFNQVKSNCVKIQLADHIPNELINKIDGIELIHWPKIEYLKYFNNLNDYYDALNEFEDLIKNNDFIEAFISYIFTK